MKRSLLFLFAAAAFMLIGQSSILAQAVDVQNDDVCGSASMFVSPKVNLEPAPLGFWGTAASLPTTKRYHTVASYNGMIYVFGGVIGSTYDTKSYKYDPQTDTWTAIADFPAAKWLFGQAQTINGKIYITAGLENINSAYKTLSACYEYDPEADTYMQVSPMPKSQGYCATGVIDNKMYIIAGSGKTLTDTLRLVQVYDPATDTWSEATPYPRFIRFLSGATVNNKIIASGGYTPNYSFRYIADTYMGEMVGGILQWTKAKDYPIGPAIYMSGAGLGDYAYFFGGRPSIDDNNPATARSFRYNVTNDTWQTLDNKPTGIQCVAQAGVSGNKIYAPGGEDANSTSVDVNEYIDAQASGSAALVLDKNLVDLWLKKDNNSSTIITITNNGSVDLTWTASYPATSWLTMVRKNGTATALGGTDKMEISFVGSQMSLGDNTVDITLTTNDPNKPTVTIPVTVHVLDAEVDTDPVVLLEEGTGTWCGYCPYGADSVKAVLAQNPGKVVAVAIHEGTNDPMQTAFTTFWANAFNVTSYPSAVINRTKFTGQTNYWVSRGVWGSYCNQILATKRSPVSITVKKSFYDPATKQISLDFDVLFHQGSNKAVRLSIAQVQNNMICGQSYYPASGGSTVIGDFEHNHVLRQVIPDNYGEVLNTTGTTLAPLTTVSKHIAFTSCDSTRETSALVYYVHYCDGTTMGEVIQAGEIEVNDIATDISSVKDPASFELLANYPNPFNPSTTIAYNVGSRSNVQIIVSDLLGREITTLVNGTKEPGLYNVLFNAGSNPSGSYLVTMKAGSFTQTRMMSLVK
jgi:N-acetylneuraminic acid mutarotase